MVAESPTPYRYGVWGGTRPRQRHEIAEALGHPAVEEYLRRLQTAVDAWQRPQAGHVATDAA